MEERRSCGRNRYVVYILAFAVLLGLVLWDDSSYQFLRQFSSSETVVSTSQQQQYRNEDNDGAVAALDQETEQRTGDKEPYNDELTRLRAKLQPRKLQLHNDTHIRMNQFLHLHHMKTGGTSLDGLIRCGMHRLQDTLNLQYASIHECGYDRYQACIHNKDPHCVARIQNAGILSYCAPLHDLQPSFGWNTTNIPAAITVLRHPVHRVYSMFRFQTKACYSCQPLLDIYKDIDAGNSTLSENCRNQLLNHQTRNLLAEQTNVPNDMEQAEAAIRNMKAFFTMVGLTEDMTSTAKMVEAVFPWLAHHLDWDAAIFDAESLGVTPHASKLTCELGHQNASPKNNRCRNGQHWDLPDHPDDATAAAILAHNAMDLHVYEAAVALFEQQKQALNIIRP